MLYNIEMFLHFFQRYIDCSQGYFRLHLFISLQHQLISQRKFCLVRLTMIGLSDQLPYALEFPFGKNLHKLYNFFVFVSIVQYSYSISNVNNILYSSFFIIFYIKLIESGYYIYKLTRMKKRNI